MGISPVPDEGSTATTARIAIRDVISAGLVTRALQGDMRAVRAIYDLHVDAVYRIAAEFTDNKRLAREKTQDVFVCAFASIAEYRAGESLEEWLIAIALDEVRGSGCADLAYGRHYR